MILTALGHRFFALPHDLRTRRFGLNGRYDTAITGLIEEKFFEMKPRGFIGTGRLGFEMMVTMIALRAGVPVLMALPYRGYNRHWSKEYQTRFNEMICGASHIHYVSGPYAKNQGARHIDWIVKHADCALVLWDETPSALTLEIHKAMHMRAGIENVWPDFVKRTVDFAI